MFRLGSRQKVPHWLGRRRVSPERRAATQATIAAFALVAVGLAVTQFGDEATARGQETYVVASSDGGRFLIGLDSVAVGSRSGSGMDESYSWDALGPSEGRVAVGDDFSLLARGSVADDALTEARLVFSSVAYVSAGVLHELPVPQDTLRLHVPGDPGRPGDTLYLEFDVARSLEDHEGLLRFVPFVSYAAWLRPAEGSDGPVLGPGGVAGDGSDGGGVPVGSVSDSSEDASGGSSGANNGSGRGGGTGGGGNGGSGGGSGGGNGGGNGNGSGSGDGPDAPEEVGRMRVFVRDLSRDDVRHLNTTFSKVAVQPDGASGPVTYFEGGREVDLRAYDGPDDRAQLVAFQAPAGQYASLQFEFSRAEATITLTDHDLVVPQPTLVVEEPFRVMPGGTTEVLVDFSIEESLALGAEGWEFRPVVHQFQRSTSDTDGDGIYDVRDPDDDNDGVPDSSDPDRDGNGQPDARPAQYRAGGSSLPSLGGAEPPDEELPEGGDRVDQAEDFFGIDDDETRPVGSDDSLVDPSRVNPDAATEGHEEPPQPEDLQIAVPTSGPSTRNQYVLQALSRPLLPDAEVLEAAGAVEVARLEALPVMLVEVVGDPAALRTLPGVTDVRFNAPMVMMGDTATKASGADAVVDASPPLGPGGVPLDGRGVGVAVIDSGIDGTHPDMLYGDAVKANLKFLPAGTVEMEDTDTSDGHGTHVAGIVAGRGHMPEYRGVAPGAALYGLGSGDAATLFWVLQGMDWVATQHDQVDPPIRVVLNAWGSSGSQHDPSSPTAAYVDALVDRGIVVVFAAGNGGGTGGTDRTTPEASDPREGVLSVAVYDDADSGSRTGSVPMYSSRGAALEPWSWPDLVAPGESITAPLALSGTLAASGAWQETPSLLYTTMSGSSMAAAHAAGVAALLLQLDPSLSPAEVERILEASAHPFDGAPGFQDPFEDARYDGASFDRGHGLIDAQAAVAMSVAERGS